MYVKIELGLEIYIWVETTCTTTAKQSWELLRSNSMKRNRLYGTSGELPSRTPPHRARVASIPMCAHMQARVEWFFTYYSSTLVACSLAPSFPVADRIDVGNIQHSKEEETLREGRGHARVQTTYGGRGLRKL